MTTEDHKYRSIVRRRLGNAQRPGSFPVLIAPRGIAFAAPEKEHKTAVRQRMRLEKLIADLSASFVGLPGNCIDAAIEEGLRKLVEALGIDHAAFYQDTGDGFEIAHSWPVAKLEGSLDIWQAGDLAWLARSLSHLSALVVPQLEELSWETSEKKFLSRLGLRSAVFVRVMTRGSLLGIVMLGSSVETIAWSGELEQPLHILGAVFAEALARKTAVDSLLKCDDLSHAMLDSLESHIVVVDKSGKVIAVSAGRHFNPESGVALLTGVNLGVNYFETCRLALERGLESAGRVLEGIESVVDGKRELFELEYEYRSPAGQEFFQVLVTPLKDSGSGAVIAHIETTERRIARAKLRELSGKMIHSLEEERTHIARELHDDLSQRLALMGLELEQLILDLPEKQWDVRRRLKDLWGRNQETSLEVRRLSHHLHPSKLEYLGLVAAARSFCKEVSEHMGVKVRFRHSDVPSSIPKEAALCLYRVIQEALRNVVKHSGTQEARVVISGSSGAIHLYISDEGAGFDSNSNITRTGIGLISMRERLLLVGGEISIDSQPSRGTRIAARVPLNEQGKDTDALKRQ